MLQLWNPLLLLICFISLLIGCDGTRMTTLRTTTLEKTECKVLDFQLARSERTGGEYVSAFYTGKIRSTATGFTVDFETPDWVSDDVFEVQGRPLLFPLMSDATGHGVDWTWLKLYCAGNTEPVFDSGRVNVEENTCFYEPLGYWVTLLEPRAAMAESGFCCDPLVPCKNP